MPQIQVIGREAVDSQNNRMTQALKQQELTQNATEKYMQFQQMSQQLKLMAKNTDNEVEKIKVQRLGDRMTYLSQVFKTAMDNPNPESVIKTALQLGGKDIMADMSDPLVQDMLKNLQPSGDAALKDAQAKFVNSQIPQTSNPVSGDSTQPQVNALNGNVPGSNPTGGNDWSAMNIGGINFENYPAQARGAAMKTEATANAQKNIDMQPIRASVGNYLNTFDNAVQEMGGLETNALSALGKGKVAELSAQIGNKPNIFTLSKLIEPVSLQLGSYLNKGRPTDKDQSAAKDTLTRLTYTKGANEILRNFLNTIATTGDKDLSTKLFWTLAKEGGSNSPDARAYSDPNMLSGKPATQRFIIRENK